MTLASSVFQSQLFPRGGARELNTRRGRSKLEAAGGYLKVKHGEEAGKDIGSLVMREHGPSVSDVPGMCWRSSCVPAPGHKPARTRSLLCFLR